jgi:prephenate dehydrogenase
VIDVCGVKRAICEPLWQIAEKHGFLFVGGHPMAGVEHSGLEYATDTMFDRASMILTPPPGTDIQTLERLKKFFLGLGFRQVVFTTAEEHDQVIAYTSQLPHVVASAYVRSPLMLGHHGFSAGSFRDMSRVTGVDENLWTELFRQNREPLLAELDGLIERLAQYRDALRDGDEEGLRGLLREGRERKAETEKRGKMQ